MRLAALLLTGAVAAGATLASTGPQASSVESGWWNTAAVGPLAVPSATPSGQLQVSNGFNGPLAFSAVRFTIPSSIVPPSQLTLQLATTGTTIGTPAVSACPTTSKWKSGDDQPASAAPGYDCRTEHQAAASAHGSESWTIPAGWAVHGVVSIALVPTAGTTSPFSVSYTAPTVASITITQVVLGDKVPGVPPLTSPNTAPVPTAPPATVASSVPANSFGGGSPVTQPPPPTVPPPNLGPMPAVADHSPGPAVVAAPASAPAGGGTAPRVNSRRGARILAFVLLLATAGAMVRAGARPHREPRSLLRKYASPTQEAHTVAAATASVRGIGRFAKPRTAPPTRI